MVSALEMMLACVIEIFDKSVSGTDYDPADPPSYEYSGEGVTELGRSKCYIWTAHIPIKDKLRPY